MCNLSQGLIEQGYDKFIANLLDNGKTPKEIADFCGIPIFRKIIVIIRSRFNLSLHMIDCLMNGCIFIYTTM